MSPVDPNMVKALCKHESTGRYIDDSRFSEEVEKITGHQLKIRKPGAEQKAWNQVWCPRNSAFFPCFPSADRQKGNWVRVMF
jgi:hypothetical protein